MKSCEQVAEGVQEDVKKELLAMATMTQEEQEKRQKQ
jgi:hypothetical protein